jgi:PilZ domain
MTDNRSTSRNRTLKTAKIILNDNQSVIDCAVKDISTAGAKIKTPTAMELPLEFELHLVADSKIVLVRRQWQKGDTVGVVFSGSPRSASRQK